MKLKHLFIDKEIKPSRDIDIVIDRTGLFPETVTSSQDVFDAVNGSADPILKGKTVLYITRNQGAVIKKCPGTSHYTCCDYTILHTGTYCTMDCSYCILQAYFHPPVLQYFAERDRMLGELNQAFHQDRTLRIGTGEFTDSLIWEPISDLPQTLVRTFSRQRRAILELKTKTVNIDSLKAIDHNHKTIIAWSLNTPKMIKTQERGTASLEDRLKAAARCESWGYRLAFHFDPLIIYDGCETEYAAVARQIFDHVSPESIAWISLGTFRFMPALKPIIESRFPRSTIAYGEFVLGLDNKMRYFRPLRTVLYKALITAVRERAPDVLVYFCMENKDIWLETLGYFPEREGDLGRILDQSAIRLCGLDV